MGSLTYAEKLRDPRWQRRRLEIMQRDNYACKSCGDDKSTLNVHHSAYIRGKMPWEYDDEFLHTVCERCHKDIEHVKIEVLVWLGPDVDTWFLCRDLLNATGGKITHFCACIEMLQDDEWREQFYQQWLNRQKAKNKAGTPVNA